MVGELFVCRRTRYATTNRPPRLHPPHHRRTLKPFAVEQRDNVICDPRVAGDEQTARGLRVGEQGAVDVGEIGGECDVLAIARPVATGGTGDVAGGGDP